MIKSDYTTIDTLAKRVNSNYYKAIRTGTPRYSVADMILYSHFRKRNIHDYNMSTILAPVITFDIVLVSLTRLRFTVKYED